MKKSKNEHSAQDSFHLKEISQGRPHEISFSVLDQISSGSRSGGGFFSRFRRKNKGSYEGFGPSMAIGSGENTALKDALGTEYQTPADSVAAAASQAAQAAQAAKDAQATQDAQAALSNQPVAPLKISRRRRYLQGKHTKAAAPAKQRKPLFGKKKPQEEVPFLPNATNFSAEAHAEIGRRQKRRARSRLTSILLVAVVVVMLATFVGVWGYQEYQKSRSERELITEACTYIESSDITLVAVEEFFSQPFGHDTISRAEELRAQIPGALDLLRRADEAAQRAEESIRGTSADKEAAQNARKAIVSRETMLQLANQKLNIDINAKRSLDNMNLMKSNFDFAQTLLGKGASLIRNTSAETATTSSELFAEARTKLEEAQTALKEIMLCFPNGNFAIYGDYINKRLEEIKYGLLSNDAIQVQDRQTAEENNELYNKADQEASELAKSFPDPFAQPLIDVYTQESNSIDEQLKQQRNQVGTYDSFLRSYLGNETQK